MEVLTEIKIGQKLGTKALIRWLEISPASTEWRYGHSIMVVEPPERLICDMSNTTFTVYWPEPNQKRDRVSIRREGFIEFYNKFYGLTKPTLKEVKSSIASKEKLTPDQYYIIYRAENKKYYTALILDVNTKSSFNGPGWRAPTQVWEHSTIYVTGIDKEHGTWCKTFDQLSIEEKAQLQKLNPARYKEWAEFYESKLKEPAVVPITWHPDKILLLSTSPTYFPDGWPSGKGGWSVVDKDYFNSLKPNETFVAQMWVDPVQVTKLRVPGNVATVRKFTDSFTHNSRSLQDLNSALYDRVLKATQPKPIDQLEAIKAANKSWVYHGRLMSEEQRGMRNQGCSCPTGHPPCSWCTASLSDDPEEWPEEEQEFYGYVPQSSSNYKIGYDPYQADFETQGVITVYERHSNGAYECISNQQINNSPIKQQKHEVPRQVNPISGPKSVSGHRIQSKRVELTVTVGHLKHWPGSLYTKEDPGRHKVGISI